MPQWIRQLPCKVRAMVEEKSMPAGLALYNPSRAGRYTYIRATTHTASGEVNSALIHDAETGKQFMVPSPWEKLAPHRNMFSGVEDLRIVEWKDRVWFGGTCTHASMAHNNELIVGWFAKDFSSIEHVRRVDIGSRPVKNVCPFVVGDRLCFLDVYLKRIYALVETPINVAENADHARWVERKDPCVANGTVWTVETTKDLTVGAGIDIASLRGSTSPVHLHGSVYGCCVHDVIFNQNARLVTRLSYLHFWMEFNIASGSVTFLSTPFFMAHWGVEYCSGIHLDRDSGKVALYVGVQDRMAVQCDTTLHDLRIGI